MKYKLVLFLLLSCNSLTYHFPKKSIPSIKFLNPNGDIYAYINLSKNRYIYNDLALKYKIGLSHVGNLYLSYKKYENEFSAILTGNFPKNIFLGLINNPNFQSIGNIFISPKWKLKNSEIYITPNKAQTVIVINQKEKLEKHENILIDYIDEIEKNEMFFYFKDISVLIPQNTKTNLIPFDSGTIVLNTNKNDYYEYNVKSVLKTDNPRVLSILAKKIFPILLKSIININIKESLETKEIDSNTVEIKLKVEKENIKNFLSNVIKASTI